MHRHDMEYAIALPSGRGGDPDSRMTVLARKQKTRRGSGGFCCEWWA